MMARALIAGACVTAALMIALLGMTPALGAARAAAVPEAAPAGDDPAPAAASPEDAAPARDETAAGPQPKAEAEADADSPEIFVPSEEISEDYAVSFPVDI